jgi:SAM-dependent methyltransferase
MELLDEDALERSPVVANNRMNRERRASGVNSYARELGFDPLELLRATIHRGEPFAWLDLCCGRGRALLSAWETLTPAERGQVNLHGIDLIHGFDPIPVEAAANLRLEATAWHRWQATCKYDLITCVHGLHYLGDKLALIARAASWLTSHGRFAASLDLRNFRSQGDDSFARTVKRWLLGAGFTYDARRRVLNIRGRRDIPCPFAFVGADANAGPNYTGQEAVNSYYQAVSRDC